MAGDSQVVSYKKNMKGWEEHTWFGGVDVCVYVCICVYMCVCVCVYVYVCGLQP